MDDESKSMFIRGSEEADLQFNKKPRFRLEMRFA